MIGYIYFLEEKDSKNIFYVGSSFDPNTRKAAHRAGSKRADSPLYSYMSTCILDFTLNIIEEIHVSSKEELLEVESYWINQFKAWGFDLKNTILYKNKRKLYTNPNDNAFPIRLGELKPLLQEEAFKLDISLHALILRILDSHLNKSKFKSMPKV